MRIDVRRLGGADLVLVEGSLDLATTPRLRAVLDARVAEGRVDLVLDLDRVKLLDAGAAGMLVKIANLAERRGGTLCAVGVHGISLDVLEIVGLDKRLHTYDEPADILARFPVEEPSNDSHARWPGSR